MNCGILYPKRYLKSKRFGYIPFDNYSAQWLESCAEEGFYLKNIHKKKEGASLFWGSFSLCLNLFFSPNIHASAAGTETATTTPAATPSNPTGVVLVTHRCPPLSALSKDPQSRLWSAPGGWESTDPSFEDHLTTFKGAQWVGIRMGQIQCLYSSETPYSFPVLLTFNIFALEPHGGQWGKNLGGHLDCPSNNMQDCPFQVLKKQGPQDPYTEALRLKT